MKKLLGVMCALLLSTAAFAANPQVEIRTSMGVITVEGLSREGAENGGEFPAVREQRVLQGFHFPPRHPRLHDPGRRLQQGDGTKADAGPVGIESSNGLKNDTGTIAMARTQNPNSATAQFFINWLTTRS